MKTLRQFVLAVFIVSPLYAQQHEHTPTMQHPSDSAFAAVQRRGQGVMGVDQYTSKHVFESLPDGGRIALQREVEDSAGVAQIRQHMAEIAEQFARGDFSAPFTVHATPDVPGTRVMAARRAAIRYTVRALPRGGEVRIRTRDRDAVAAVHAFLAFQRQDHRTSEH